MSTVLDFYALKTLTRTSSFRCSLFSHHDTVNFGIVHKTRVWDPPPPFLVFAPCRQVHVGETFGFGKKKVLENNGKERDFRRNYN